MKEFVQKFSNFTKNFLESYYFLFIILVVILFSWRFNLLYLSYYVLCITTILTVLCQAKAPWILALYYLQEASRRNAFVYQGPKYIFLLVLVGILVLTVVLDVIIHRKQYFYKIKGNLLFYIKCIILFSMLISLFNVPASWMKNSIEYITIFSFQILILLFSIFRIDKDSISFKKVLISLLSITLVVLIECIIKFFELYSSGIEINTIFKSKLLDLGWGISNHYITLFNLAFVACVYFFIESKKEIVRSFCILGMLILGVVNVLSFCRGAYLGLIGIIPYSFILYFVCRKNKKKDWYYIIGILLFIGVAFYIAYDQGILKVFLDTLKQKGGSLNGREEIYRLALENFKSHWIIGTGAGTSQYYIQEILGWKIINYHNYFLQISTCGLLGILGFTFYIIWMILQWIQSVKNKDLIGLVIGGCVLYFLLHGFVDTLFFHRALEPILIVLLTFFPSMRINTHLIEKSPVEA